MATAQRNSAFYRYLCGGIKINRDMRRIILCLTMLAMAGMIWAQEHDILSNAEVNDEWRQKTISVKNGGASPNIVTLLRAFHQVLPTWVVGEVLDQADHPAKSTRQSGSASIYEDENDYRILIDTRNGYVDLESETDMDQMSACVWRKDNGHKIFAVTLYEQHVMPQNLLCWYDYDPQTQTMTPAKSPLDAFTPDLKEAFVGWCLPRQGTDFTITEYYVGLPAITHVYKWDRKAFTRDHTEMADFEYKLAADSKATTHISEGNAWTHYGVLDFTESGSPILAFCNFYEGEIGDMLLIGDFKGNHVALGTKTMDGEKLNVFRLPDDKKGNKRVAVVHRDMAGGLWYNIMLGNLVQYQVCDLPNFADPDGGRSIKVTAGFGADDETTDIIGELGDWIDISKYWRWDLIEIKEGEEEAP